VKILFAEAAAEAFAELPQSTKRKAASSIELLEQNPRIYPVQRRGIMRGYRYFAAGTSQFWIGLRQERRAGGWLEVQSRVVEILDLSSALGSHSRPA